MGLFSLSLSLSLSSFFDSISFSRFFFLSPLLFCIYTYHSSDSDAPLFYILLFHLFLSTLTRSRPPTRHCFPTVWKKQNKPRPNFFFLKKIKTKSKCNQQTDVFFLPCFLLFWWSTTNKKKKPWINCVTERINPRDSFRSKKSRLYSRNWVFFIVSIRWLVHSDSFFSSPLFYINFYWRRQPFWSGAFCARWLV